MFGFEDEAKVTLIKEGLCKPKQTVTPWYDSVIWTDDGCAKNITGRDFVGWVKFWTFYAIFLLILLIITTGMLIIILQLIVSNDEPYLTGSHSPLQLSPGLGMRPRIDFRTALIAYAASDPQTYMPYVQNIRTFVYMYEEVNIKPQEGFATCEKSLKSPDNPDLVCKYYPQEMGDCVKENNYGYDRSQPCVILKINNNSQDLENFGTVRYFPNVTIGDVTYGYFSNLYYPYLVQVAYRSPLVAVQFESPKRHVLLMVRCQLLNIRNPGEPAQFELLVD
ncbi:unnamed protein product [Dicrocoelium dendriticum]|nr:unnamed protein product [Dicrocoelium dendriticum]